MAGMLDVAHVLSIVEAEWLLYQVVTGVAVRPCTAGFRHDKSSFFAFEFIGQQTEMEVELAGVQNLGQNWPKCH